MKATGLLTSIILASTSFTGACSILENKEFWLFNLIKNFDDEEFRLFYEEHNITGYKSLV